MPSENWNHDMVHAGAAYASLVDPATGEIDWGDIEVGHVDTGYTRHSVFGPWSGDASPTLQVARGLNLLDPGEPPSDPLGYGGQPGHGTRTASVLCGNLAGTFVGLAPGLPTIPYRAVNRVALNSSRKKRVAQAIMHAVDVNRCEVISISLGAPIGGGALGEAVDHAYEKGVIVVAAGGQVTDRVTYPGKFARTIGVGGVEPDRKVWFKYSNMEGANYAKFLDVWAPASPILRANTVLQNDAPVEAPLKTGDGTSYATVHVVAAAAMWLVKRGEEIEDKYEHRWQRVEAFRSLVRSTRQDMEGDYQPAAGTGILDISAVLDAALPDNLEHQKRLAKKEKF